MNTFKILIISNFNSLDIFGLIPDVFLIICVFLVLLFYLFCYSMLKNQIHYNLFKQMFYKNGLVFFVWVLYLMFYLEFKHYGLVDFFYTYDLLKKTEFIVFFKLYMLILLMGYFFVCLAYTNVSLLDIKKYNTDKINCFEFPIIIVFSILAMFFLVECNDLICMYLCIELQALCFFILASWRRSNEYCLEAGLKYFFLGVFASCFLLLGICFVYISIGTTNFEDLIILFGENLILNTKNSWFFFFDKNITITLLIGLVILLIGFLFKIGAAPFHFWLPDVYEGSITLVTCFFSIFPKITLIIFIIRLYIIVLYSCFNVWSVLLNISLILCFFFGVLGALNQHKIKRFLAYASIVQIGLILLSFCNLNQIGLFSSLIFLTMYIIMVFGVFNVLLISKNYNLMYRIQYLHNFRFFIFYNPLLGLTLVFILFSFAGIPPFVGFFTKMLILLSSVQSNFIFFSIILLVANVIGCFYYIRIIKIIMFDLFDYIYLNSYFGIGLFNKNGWLTLFLVNREISLILGIVFFIISFFGYSENCFYDLFSYLSYKTLRV